VGDAPGKTFAKVFPETPFKIFQQMVLVVFNRAENGYAFFAVRASLARKIVQSNAAMCDF